MSLASPAVFDTVVYVEQHSGESIWIQLCAGEFVASTVSISYQHYLSLFEELIFSCPEAIDCAVQTRTLVQSFPIFGGLSSDS